MAVIERPIPHTEPVTRTTAGFDSSSQPSTSNTLGGPIPLGEVATLYRQVRSKIGTGGMLAPKMLKVGTTTGGFILRIEPLRTAPKPITASILSPAEMVSVARAALSFNIKELAQILGVQRPTVYAWIGGEAEPQPENLRRLNALVDCARRWSALTNLPLGEDVRRPHFENGKSLIDLLTVGSPGSLSVKEELQFLAKEVTQKNAGRKRTSVRGVLAARGLERSGSSETLDLMTGKRMGDER